MIHIEFKSVCVIILTKNNRISDRQPILICIFLPQSVFCLAFYLIIWEVRSVTPYNRTLHTIKVIFSCIYFFRIINCCAGHLDISISIYNFHCILYII